MPRGQVEHRLSAIDKVTGWATCRLCGPVKLRVTGKGTRAYCSTSAMLSRSRLNALKSGGYKPLDPATTKAELDEAILRQQGRCAVCSRARPDLVPDHCHETGRLRGWLCPNCNSALGMLQDDPQRLRAALEYLSLG